MSGLALTFSSASVSAAAKVDHDKTADIAFVFHDQYFLHIVIPPDLPKETWLQTDK